MPNASKGNRTRVSTRLPVDVAQALEELRAKTGVSSESQLVADVLALVTGHSELVVELDQGILFDLGLDQKLHREEVLPLTA